MTSQKRYQRMEVLTAGVGDQLLMMSVELGRYFSLNDVGMRIWELLEAPITAEELIERLLSEYAVEPELCRKQVGAYLEGLRTRALLAETCA